MEYGFTIRTKAEASLGVSDPKRINFHSDLTASAALLEFREREKSETDNTDKFCTEIFASELREYIRIILAAFRDDASRQRKSNKGKALRFLKKCANSFLGFGHGESNAKIHHGGLNLHELKETARVFLKYVTLGKNRMELEKAAYENAVIEYNENLLMNAIGE